MKTQFEKLSEIATNNGFYLKTNDLRHETFICDGGKYDGESIEIYWNPSTGRVHHVDYVGVNNAKANFSFSRFWDAQPILKK